MVIFQLAMLVVGVAYPFSTRWPRYDFSQQKQKSGGSVFSQLLVLNVLSFLTHLDHKVAIFCFVARLNKKQSYILGFSVLLESSH